MPVSLRESFPRIGKELMCRPSGRGKDRRLIPLIIDLSQSSPFLLVSLRRSWLASYTISVSREESFRYNNSASDNVLAVNLLFFKLLRAGGAPWIKAILWVLCFLT